jgi:hypothetical protein
MTPPHDNINSTKQVHPIQMIGPTMLRFEVQASIFPIMLSFTKNFELGAKEFVKGSHKNEWY